MEAEQPPAPPSLTLRVASVLIVPLALIFPVGVSLSLIRSLSRAPTAAIWLLSTLGVVAAIVVSAQRLRVKLDERRRLTHQQRRLTAQLQEARLLEVDPRDPRRQALEQRFWRGEHHFALARLREPPPAPELWALLRAQLARTSAGFVTMFVTQIVIGIVLWCFVGDKAALAIAGMMALGLVLGSSMMVVDALRVHRRQRQARAEHLRERRRLATMAELAGGLSLAEQPDELRGALSGDAVQGGELEEAGP